MQPFGVEKVNLPRIFTQGGESCRIRRIIESRADSFVDVKFHLRGWNIGPSPRTARLLLAALESALPFSFLQRMVGMLLEFEQRLLQRLAAQGGVDKDDDHNTDNDAGDIEQSSNPFPSRPARIVKNRFPHAI